MFAVGGGGKCQIEHVSINQQVSINLGYGTDVYEIIFLTTCAGAMAKWVEQKQELRFMTVM